MKTIRGEGKMPKAQSREYDREVWKDCCSNDTKINGKYRKIIGKPRAQRGVPLRDGTGASVIEL